MALGFLLGYTPWGAHPGNTRQEIGSGTGFVHNAFLLDGIEETVLRGAVRTDAAWSGRRLAVAVPRPPYFVTNPTGLGTVSRLTAFTAAPNPLLLPGILTSALRG